MEANVCAKTKILFLQPNVMTGGVETVLVNYLNILAEKESFDIELVIFEQLEGSYFKGVSPKVKISFLLNEIESEFYRYNYFTLLDGRFSGIHPKQYYSSCWDYIFTKRLERLSQKLKANKYDLIVDFKSTLIDFTGDTDFLNQIDTPIISFIHSYAEFGRWLNFIEKVKDKLSAIEMFISVSQEMKMKCDEVLSHSFGLSKNSQVLFNPIDKAKILKLANEEEYLDQKLLCDSFILQVGRLDEGKNHLKMIDIFYKLKQRGVKEKLYIIGGGDFYNILQDKIKSLHLENECLLLGNKDNPFPFMKKARLFIHTSDYEGLPTVFIESMICGVPIVSFDCPTGPREILENGKYGELIPMGDDELFVEKTYELLINEQRRQHYISLLPEAVERFSFDKIGQQFFELIAEVKNKTRN